MREVDGRNEVAGILEQLAKNYEGVSTDSLKL
jgi:hypothetical protein